MLRLALKMLYGDRAKYAMLVQATVSLILFALVFARAVNAFS